MKLSVEGWLSVFVLIGAEASAPGTLPRSSSKSVAWPCRSLLDAVTLSESVLRPLGFLHLPVTALRAAQRFFFPPFVCPPSPASAAICDRTSARSIDPFTMKLWSLPEVMKREPMPI